MQQGYDEDRNTDKFGREIRLPATAQGLSRCRMPTDLQPTEDVGHLGTVAERRLQMRHHESCK